MAVEITKQPTPGKSYKIKKDDWLTRIAARAYGQSEKWTIISDANKQALRSGDPNLIFPGEIVFIPKLAERKKPKTLKGKDKDDLSLVIDDVEIPVKDLKVLQTMDTAAWGWTASIAWTPGLDSKLDKATKEYGFQDATAFLGNDALIEGRLYIVTPDGNAGGRTKTLAGFSLTKDAIDSTFNPPFEFNNQTLKQVATKLIEPLGISVIWDIDDDLKFKKITASESDKIMPFLQKYIKQRGALLSTDSAGNVVALKANAKGESVGTIEDGKHGYLGFKTKFDGTKRFNATKMLSQSPKKTGKKSGKAEIAKDENIPTSRMQTLKAPDATAGDLKGAAEWARSKSIADALNLPFDAEGFYAPNGERFAPNTIITVKSDVISLPEGADLLITKVEFSKTNNGNRTMLSLVAPQVYTGEPIPDIFVGAA
jgi:prophage tail gpP-like protein